MKSIMARRVNMAKVHDCGGHNIKNSNLLSLTGFRVLSVGNSNHFCRFLAIYFTLLIPQKAKLLLYYLSEVFLC